MSLYRIEPSPKTLSKFNELAAQLEDIGALRDIDERNLTLDATVGPSYAEDLERAGHGVTNLEKPSGFGRTPTFDPTLV